MRPALLVATVAALLNSVAGAAPYSPRSMLPPGCKLAFLNSALGNDQVGQAQRISDSSWHAYLWHGTAASAIDMTPPGYTTGSIDGVFSTPNGNIQVGEEEYVYSPGSIHDGAVAW